MSANRERGIREEEGILFSQADVARIGLVRGACINGADLQIELSGLQLLLTYVGR